MTGTGTGAGKTLLSVALCLKLKAKYWKPIQTGSPSDSAFAARFLPRERIFKSAFRFRRPLSPNQAARREGRSFKAADIVPPPGFDLRSVPLKTGWKEAPRPGADPPEGPRPGAGLQKIRFRRDRFEQSDGPDGVRPVFAKESFLVTEGIGGVFVPLNDRETVLDLIERLQFPVLIAALSGLGTLNHSLLTLQALRRSPKIPVLGLVLSGPSHPDNKRDLERTGKIPVFELKQLPSDKNLTPKDFEEALDPKITRIFL